MDDLQDEAEKKNVKGRASDAKRNAKGLLSDTKDRFGKKDKEDDESEVEDEPPSPTQGARRRSKRKGRTS